MAKHLLALVLLTTTVTSEDPPTLSTDADLPLDVQEGGSFSVVFALSGFSLDPSVLHQSTLVAPDSAWLWLSPNTTVWKDHTDLVLRPGISGARPDTWKIRYEGSSVEQLGLHVEGVSEYDSGNWSLLVRPSEALIVRAGFEVKVEASPTATTSTTISTTTTTTSTTTTSTTTSTTISTTTTATSTTTTSTTTSTTISTTTNATSTTTTSTTTSTPTSTTTTLPEDVAPIFGVSITNDVPISVEEGGDFSVVFDLRGFTLNPFNNRQSSFITPDRNIFWVTPFNTTWKGVEIGSLGAQPRPTSWRVRYTGNGTAQVGLELESATVHDSGRWNLRINIAGPYWATAEFMVAVENSTTTTGQTTTPSSTTTTGQTTTTTTSSDTTTTTTTTTSSDMTTGQTTTTSSDMTTGQTTTTSSDMTTGQTMTTSSDMTTPTSVATIQTVANTAMLLAILFTSFSS